MSDRNNNRIQIFNSTGSFITEFGSLGNNPGEFIAPRGVAVDGTDRIIVSDTSNNRIQIFNSTGSFITEFGSLGDNPGEFDSPRRVAVDSFDNIFVTDGDNHRIQQFDSTGTFLGEFGGPNSNPGEFNFPRSVDKDSNNRIITTDTENHRIQIFDSTGTFVDEFGSEGSGPGQFNFPHSVAIDSTDRIIISDTFNNRIQIFDSAGSFITEFGSFGSGPGQFNVPVGVATDSNNRIIVVDNVNNRIQIFDSAGSFITEFGSQGSGPGQFFRPSGVTTDNNDRIVVVDQLNDRIQIFNSTANFVDEFGSGGSGPGQFNLPTSVTTDNTDRIIISDSLNDRIQIFDSAGTFQTEFGSIGNNPAQFNLHQGLSIDNLGRLLVADTYNHRIQIFDPPEIPEYDFLFDFDSTDVSFNSLSGIATDSNNRLIVADTNNSIVQIFDPSGNHVTTFGSPGSAPGQFDTPQSVAVDSFDRILVMDTNNNRIQVFDSAGTFVDEFGSNGFSTGQFNIPVDIAVDNLDQILVADFLNNRIQIIKLEIGACTDGVEIPSGSDPLVACFIDEFGTLGSGNGQFSFPEGIAVDSSGRIIISDTGNHRVQVFTSEVGSCKTGAPDISGTGNPVICHSHNIGTGSSGSATGEFTQPRGISTDSFDNVVVSDNGNHRIQIFDSAGVFLETFGSQGSFFGQFETARDIAIDSNNRLVVADTGNNRVQVFGSAPVLATDFLFKFGSLGPATGQFDFPSDLTIDPVTRNILIADRDNHRIQILGPDGTFIDEFGSFCDVASPGGTCNDPDGGGPLELGDGQFNNASYVAVDPATRNIIVSDRDNNRIQVFNSTGNFLFKFGSLGSAPGQFDFPLGVTVDPANSDIIVADSSNFRVQIFDSIGNFADEFGSQGFALGQLRGPTGVAVDPATSNILVTELNNHRVQIFDSSGNPLIAFGEFGASDGKFNGPSSVAVDPATNSILVVDELNHRAQIFDAAGNHQVTFGGFGTAADGKFFSPSGIAVDPATNSIVVSDTGNNRVQVFGTATGLPPNTDFLFKFGSSGSGPGQFNTPADVVIDSVTNKILVSDSSNHRVQIFDADGNFVDEFGTLGSTDGQFNGPIGIAFDPTTEDIVVSDRNNDRIQVFDSNLSHKITFGEFGSADGQFDLPFGVEINPGTSEIVVADRDNHRIQVFDTSGINQLTFGAFGFGDGQLNAPRDVAVDPVTEHFIVADSLNHRIQIFGEQGEFIKTFGEFGSADGQFNAPNGISIDPVTRNILVADTNNHRIQIFDFAGNFIATFGSGGSADGQFNAPANVAVDPATNRIMVTDQLNNRIQVFGTAPPVVPDTDFLFTFGSLGSANGQLNTPSDVDVDSSNDNILVADTENDRIQIFDSSGAFIDTFGSLGSGNGQFDFPLGVTKGNSNLIAVSDTINNRIQIFDSAGNFVDAFGTVGSAAGQFQSPRGLVIDSADRIIVSDTSNNRIQIFAVENTICSNGVEIPSGVGDPVICHLSDLGTGTPGSADGQFNLPRSVTVDSADRIIVSDTSNNRIQIFDSSGAFISKFGTVGSAPGQFDFPLGVSTDNNDNVLVADSNNDRIQIFDPTGNLITTFGSLGSADGQFDKPRSVTADSLNRIIVSDTLNNRIQVFGTAPPIVPDTDFLFTFGSAGISDSEFNAPHGAAVVATTGNMVISDRDNHRIQIFDSSGNHITTFGSNGAANGQFAFPQGLAVDPATDNILVADRDNHRIQIFNSSGSFVDAFGTLGTGTGQFSSPSDVAVDPATDNIIVADRNNDRIQIFNSTGSFIDTFGSNGTGPGQFFNPAGVAVDPVTSNIIVADTDNDLIQVFDSSGSFITTFGTLGSAIGEFFSPVGIAVDPVTSNIFVADRKNNRIQVFDSSGSFITTFGTLGSATGQFDTPFGIAVDSAGNIVVSDTLNNRIQVFGTTPTLSGIEKVVFISGRDGDNEIFIMNPDGSDQTQLTNNAANESTGDLSPDGTSIVFTSVVSGTNQVYVMSHTGTNITQLTSGAENAGGNWSPDGTKILFSSFRDGDWEVYVMDADGSNQVRLTTSPGIDNHADWSDDGTEIVFRSDRDGNSRIYKMDADGSNQVDLSQDSFSSRYPNWSPDGSLIAYSSTASPGGIFVMNAVDGSGKTNLISGTINIDPHWSPDGSKIVYEFSSGGNEEIHIADSDGQNQINLTNNGFSDRHPKMGIVPFALSSNDDSAPPPAKFDAHLFSIGRQASDAQFMDPFGIAVSPANQVYIVDQNNHRIQVFDNSSNHQFNFGSVGRDDGEFIQPGGVTIGNSGEVIVVDRLNGRLQIFDAAGNHQSSLGGFGILNDPHYVAVDSNNFLFITEENRHQVTVYDLAGNQVNQFGTFGSGPGEFSVPDGIATDSQDRIYVVDTGNNRVQIFSSINDPSPLNYLTEFGISGSGNGEFNTPRGIALDNNEDILVGDSGNRRVQIFSSFDGTNPPPFADAFGSAGTGPGQFDSIFGVAVDLNNQIYVSDSTNNRVQVFSPFGGSTPFFLFEFGSGPTDDDQLDTPNGVAVDTSDRILIADTGNDRIQIFTKSGGTTENLSSFPFTGNGAPIGIATNSNDDILSTNSGGTVEVFDASGTPIMTIGSTACVLSSGLGCNTDSPGANELGDGQFNSPFSVDTTNTDGIVVADSINHRIQIFDSSGTYVDKFGSQCVISSGSGCVDPDGAGPLQLGDGQFNVPIGVTVDNANGEKRILVTDQLNHRVEVFTIENNSCSEGIEIPSDAGSPVICHLDSVVIGTGIPGSLDGEFAAPSSTVTDNKNNIYVVDSNNFRIQVFDKNGNHLETFGDLFSANDPFIFPFDAAIDGDGNLIVSEYRMHRVQAFGESPESKSLDIAVANGDDNTVSVFLNNENGTISSTSSADFSVDGDPNAIQVADIDKDGLSDIMTGNANGQSVSLLLNNGDGFRTIPSFSLGAQPSNSIAIDDFDNNGLLDIVVSDWSGSSGTDVLIGLNLGNGTALSFDSTGPVANGANAVATGDFDEDGFSDVLVSSWNTDEVIPLFGDGQGNLIPGTAIPVGDRPQTIVVSDFDLDSDKDFAVVNAASQNISILLGDGAGSFSPQPSIALGTNPSKIAVGDMNNDAVPDLIVTEFNSPTGSVSVLLGDKTGAFPLQNNYYLAGGFISDVHVADLNDDNNLDVVTTNQADNTFTVFYGDGTGSLRDRVDIDTGNAPKGLAVGNFEQTTKSIFGNLDILTANRGLGPSVSILYGDGLNSYVRSDVSFSAQPNAIKSADFNNDGLVDFVTGNALANSISIALNSVNGFDIADFSLGYEAASSLEVGDFNNDGNQDIFVPDWGGSTGTRIQFLLGDGTGGFTPSAFHNVAAGPIGPSVGDLNHDGNLDAVVANWNADSITVLFGNGNGGVASTLALSAGVRPAETRIGDFNNDNNLDLIAANTLGGTATVYLGDGIGNFALQPGLLTSDNSAFVDIGDLNNDGLTDVVIGDRESPTSQIYTFLGDGDGLFSFSGDHLFTLEFLNRVMIGDVNDDGNNDIVSVQEGGTLSVFVGNGDGSFQPRFDTMVGDGPFSLDITQLHSRILPNLEVVSSIGDRPVDGEFFGPRGIAINPNNDDIAVADTFNQRIQVFDIFGNHKLTFSSFGSLSPQVITPDDVEINPLTNDIFVADRQNHKIKAFDEFGKLLFDFGGFGTLDGQFIFPNHISIDSASQQLVVSDEINNRVQVFELNNSCPVGTTEIQPGVCHVVSFGSNGSSDGQFNNPQGVAFSPVGNTIAVSDSNNHRIQVFELNNSCPVGTTEIQPGVCHVVSFGSNGSSDGQFGSLRGITFDSSGVLYVPDYINDRIQVFELNNSCPVGTTEIQPGVCHIESFGVGGNVDGQFNDPYDISLSSSGIVGVVDSSNHRIQLFDLQSSCPVGTTEIQPGVCHVRSFGFESSGNNDLATPYSSLVHPVTGDMFVSDTFHSRIQVYDSDGVFTNSFSTGTHPYDLELDSANDVLYVARGSSVLLLDATTGSQISTIGSGFCNIATGSGCVDPDGSGPLELGDGQFHISQYLALDSDDNLLYVSDLGNHRVQVFNSTTGDFLFKFGSFCRVSTGTDCVDPDGTGPLELGDGQLNSPRGIDIDLSSDELYVADAANSRIQVFDATSGDFVFKFGTRGTDSGEFVDPMDVVLDESGFVYVSEFQNHRVQVFDKDGSFVTSFGQIGSSLGQIAFPRGISLHPTNGEVFVGDTHNDRIQIFGTGLPSTQFLDTIGLDPINGEFKSPGGVAVNKETGDIYVADSSNHRIQVFDFAGNFVKSIGMLGNPGTGISLPNDVDVINQGIPNDASDDLLVVVFSNDVTVYDMNGTIITSFGGFGTASGLFNNALGVTVDDTNRIIATDNGNHRVQIFDSTGAFVDEFGSHCNVNAPGPSCVDPDGSGPLDLGDGQFNQPRGIEIDPATGRIYVADLANHRVQIFDSTGVFVGKFGTPGSAPGLLSQPRDVAIASGNEIYVLEQGNQRISVFDIGGSYSRTIGSVGTSDAQFVSPQGLALRNQAITTLLVADSGNSRVQEIDPANASTPFVQNIGLATGFDDGKLNRPVAVTVDTESENIYVSDEFNHRVRVFDFDGNPQFTIGSFGSSDGEFNRPHGVAVNPQNNNLVVADFQNNRIQVFNSTGDHQLSIPNGLFNAPFGVAFDPTTNNLLVSSVNDNAVRVLQLTDSCPANTIELVTGACYVGSFGTGPGSADGQFNRIDEIEVDANTGNSYIVDLFNHRIQVFDSAGGHLFNIGTGSSGNGPGEFNLPSDIAIDSQSEILYVVDRGNSRIQMFDLLGHFLDEFETGPSSRPKGIAFNEFTGSLLVTEDLLNVVRVIGNESPRTDFLVSFGSECDLSTGSGCNVDAPGAIEPGDGQFLDPNSITQDQNGRIYVTDGSNDRIQVFDSSNNFLFKFGSECVLASSQGCDASAPGAVANGDGQFNLPRSVSVTSDGNIHVVDRANNRIQTFDSTGEFLSKFGIFCDVNILGPSCVDPDGSGPLELGDGQFNLPTDIAFDSLENFYVSDGTNGRIQVFDSTGNFISKIGTKCVLPAGPGCVDPDGLGPLELGDGQFGFASAVVVDSKDNLYVSDSTNNLIQKFDSNGNFLFKITSIESGGSLNQPSNMSIDDMDNLYITSTKNHQIHLFDSSGRFIKTFGSLGNDIGEFAEPNGIFVNDDGDILVTDSKNDRIQIFGVPDIVQPQLILSNPAPEDNDLFATTLALENNLALVGTPGDNTGADNAGSAYLYDVSACDNDPLGTVNDQNCEIPLLTFLNPTPEIDDNFGDDVALSGNLVVIGAANDDLDMTDGGGAYVFDIATCDADDADKICDVPHLTLKTSVDSESEFGKSTAIFQDNVVIGDPAGDHPVTVNTGAAYLYNTATCDADDADKICDVPTLTFVNPFAGSGANFGASTAISGSLVMIGAPDDASASITFGKAYLFDITTCDNDTTSGGVPDDNVCEAPLLTFKDVNLTATPESFGSSVSIQGNLVAIGNPGDDRVIQDAGSAYLYNITTCDADTSAGGVPGDRTCEAGSLQFLNPTPEIGENFGNEVSLSDNALVISSPSDMVLDANTGAAYLYDVAICDGLDGTVDNSCNVFAEVFVNPDFDGVSNDGFANNSIDVSGPNILIGASTEDTNPTDSGIAYVYTASVSTAIQPVANDDMATIAYDAQTEFVDVTNNDFDLGDTDFIINPLTVTSVTRPSLHGTAVVSPGGVGVSYTTNGVYAGIDSFDYEVRNNVDTFDTARATIHITGDLYVSSYDSFSDGQITRFDGVVSNTIIDELVPIFDNDGLTSPGGMAYGPHDGNLYVASSGTNEILQYGGTSGVPAITNPFVPSGGTEPLNEPRGLLFDSDVLYVANYGSNDVLRYDSIGSFKDVISDIDLSGPTDVTIGPDDGWLYVSSTENDSILAFELDSLTRVKLFDNVESPPPDPADVLDAPHGITFGPDGNLYVANTNANNILRFNSVDNALGVFGETENGSIVSPTDVFFGPDGNLYVSDVDSIVRFDGVTGNFIDEFVTAGNGIEQPTSILFGPAQDTLKFNEPIEFPEIGIAVLTPDASTHVTLFSDNTNQDPVVLDTTTVVLDSASTGDVSDPILLTETGIDTGIFINDPQVAIFLTVDDCSTVLLPAVSTSCLQVKQTDTVTATVNDATVSATATVLMSSSTGTVGLDASSGGAQPTSLDPVLFDTGIYVEGEHGTLQINSNAGTSTITALVRSSSSPEGILVTLEQDPPGSSLYTSQTMTNFIPLASQTSINRLYTNGGDTLFATYPPAKGEFSFSNDAITLGSGPGANTSADVTIDVSPHRYNGGDMPFAGDWDGDGDDEYGVYRQDIRKFYLRDNIFSGSTFTFNYGQAGRSLPIVGDWDGDGDDEVGTHIPEERKFQLRKTTDPSSQSHSPVFYGGKNNVLGIAGDWDGNGKDEIGIFKPSTNEFKLRTTIDPSNSNILPTIVFGQKGDMPIVGDWDGDVDNKDEIGVYRPSTGEFLLKHNLDPADNAHTIVRFDPAGNPATNGDVPLIGNWDGEGAADIRDTLGFYRTGSNPTATAQVVSPPPPLQLIQNTGALPPPPNETCPSDEDGVCSGWISQSGDIGLVVQGSTTPYTLSCDSFFDPTGEFEGDGPTPIPGTTDSYNDGCPAEGQLDVFLEVDWCVGHEPSDDVLLMLKDTFRKAPVQNLNGLWGVNLHIHKSDLISDLCRDIPLADISAQPGDPPSFEELKRNFFGTEAERAFSTDPEILQDYLDGKRQIFRYLLLVDSIKDLPGSSGYAEIGGNDAIGAMGPFSGGTDDATVDEQKLAGTILHELGHTLNLNHGGSFGDSINGKPNYISIMNYLLQMPDLVPDRPLDLSIESLAELDEEHLNELLPAITPLQGNPDFTTVVGGRDDVTGDAFAPIIIPSGLGIDYDRDGSPNDPDVAEDINFFSIPGLDVPSIDTLSGHDDWENIRVNFRGSPGFADGVIFVPPNEITAEILETLRLARINAIITAVEQVEISDFGDDPTSQSNGFATKDAVLSQLKLQVTPAINNQDWNTALRELTDTDDPDFESVKERIEDPELFPIDTTNPISVEKQSTILEKIADAESAILNMIAIPSGNAPSKHIPVALDDVIIVTDEVVNSGMPISFEISALDTDLDELEFEISSAPSLGILSLPGPPVASPSININDKGLVSLPVTYTIDEASIPTFVSDSFEFKVDDDSDLLSVGNISDSSTVTIVRNHAPVVPISLSLETDYKTSVLINLSATDQDNDNVIFEIVEISALGDVSSITQPVSPGDTAQITYVPQIGSLETAVIKYKAIDIPLEQTSNVGVITVDVAAPLQENNPPDANPDEVSVDTVSPPPIDVLSNDTDADGDALSIVDVDDLSANGGTIEIDDNGTTTILDDDKLIYSPPPGFTSGTDTFTYFITDDQVVVSGVVTIVADILDATPPETIIDSAIDINGNVILPDTLSTSDEITFGFTATDDISGVAGFECSIDGQAFVSCISPQSYSSLAVSAHTFQVRATDVAGNVDATPAVFNWEIISEIPPQGDITYTVTTDPQGNTVITGTDQDGVVVETVIPPGSTSDDGTVDVQVETTGPNTAAEIDDVTLLPNTTKSITIRTNPGSTHACVIDSSQNVLATGLPNCGAEDISQSRIILSCDGTTRVVENLPEEPFTREYACSKFVDTTGVFMNIDGLAFSYVTDGIHPISDANGPYLFDVGETFTLDASNSLDVDGTIELYEWDLDGDNSYGGLADVSSASSTIPVSFDAPFDVIVNLRVTDNTGLQDVSSTQLSINNVITVPIDPVPVDTEISVDATFTGSLLTTHDIAQWDWGDGTTSAGIVSGNTVTGTHIYSDAGIYVVTLSLSDGADTIVLEAQEFIVVYDPAGGFVTGGGWIDSPMDAFPEDPLLEGKATFGFVSKYKKGAQSPTGTTQFEFDLAEFEFHSSAYDWLVINKAKAIYTGTGTVNDSGNYGFLLIAIDADVNQNDAHDVDKFRIKIWDINNNDVVVYDNQPGAEDDSGDVPDISGGSIVIHESKGKK